MCQNELVTHHISDMPLDDWIITENGCVIKDKEYIHIREKVDEGGQIECNSIVSEWSRNNLYQSLQKQT